MSERPIIIGAGPGGLAVAWTLKEAGLDPVLLDRADRPFSTWHTYYRSMRMNSWRPLSSLPGMRLKSEYGPWPMRDDFINYLKNYVEVLDPDIRFGTDVRRIDRDGGRWLVRTSDGDLPTGNVVLATGLHRKPYVPDWPGLDGFTGEFLHAREYTVPDPYAGKSVLVVGCGPTGMDIVVELVRSGAAHVRMALRRTPVLAKLGPLTTVMCQAVKHGPVPNWLVDTASLLLHRIRYGDLTRYGLPAPTEGAMSKILRHGHSSGGAIERGLVEVLKAGKVEIVGGVTGFDDKNVLLDGGTSITPDVVIASTGQRPAMEGLVGHLNVLSQPGGRPLVHGGRTAPHAPGLYFQGYRLPPGQLPDMAIDARAIARAITGRGRFSRR